MSERGERGQSREIKGLVKEAIRLGDPEAITSFLQKRGVECREYTAYGSPLKVDRQYVGPPQESGSSSYVDAWGSGGTSNPNVRSNHFHYCWIESGERIYNPDGSAEVVVYNNLPEGTSVTQRVITVPEEALERII